MAKVVRVGTDVTIEYRFRGPPASAHGGYACALAAEPITGTVAVDLKAPPPLDRPLVREELEDGSVTVADDETLIAVARPAELECNVPAPVTVAEAAIASEGSPWWDRHPFPTCFGCGPARDPEDALRIVCGPVEGADLAAAPWTPHPSLAGKDGIVPSLFVRASLDCPTAVGALAGSQAGPSVLARLTVTQHAPVHAERPHTVISWPIGRDGRKYRGGAALHTAQGELCGVAEGLWIELKDPTAFAAAG